ncbi:MAG: hypothetical protein ACI8PT_000085 [Gammaproteobacteria bacterium]|jgi:hypothetical protein
MSCGYAVVAAQVGAFERCCGEREFEHLLERLLLGQRERVGAMERVTCGQGIDDGGAPTVTIRGALTFCMCADPASLGGVMCPCCGHGDDSETC